MQKTVNKRCCKRLWPAAAFMAMIMLFVACMISAGSTEALAADTAGYTAYTNNETKYKTFIDDSANLLSGDEEKALSEKMEGITAYGGAAFVTSYDVSKGGTASYAATLQNRYFSGTSGTVFLIDMSNRQIYIYSAGSINKTLTASKANTITDNVYQYAKSGKYYECASAVFTQETTLLKGGAIAEPMKYISNALIAVAAGLLICYFIVRAARSRAYKQNAAMLGAVTTQFKITDPKAELKDTKRVHNDTGGIIIGGIGGGIGGGFSGGGGSGGGGSGGGHGF